MHEIACREEDLTHIRDLGMNAVKFWVPWRRSHREADRFRFENHGTIDGIAHLPDSHGSLQEIEIHPGTTLVGR